jgi:hypothetical protein
LSIKLNIPASILKAFQLPAPDVRQVQMDVLKKLMKKSNQTAFGKYYDFEKILKTKHFAKTFQQEVGVYNYEKMFTQWWSRAKNGEENISWPGAIKYFALSSGTSEGASKFIPITKELIRSNNRTGITQFLSLGGFDTIPATSIGKSWLLLGGSTTLQETEHYFAGDVSGIQQKNIPLWLRSLYKPGKKIAQEKDWGKKLEEIVAMAPNWDVGFIAGVPAWLQIIMEKIIEHYKLNNIHEIWPNLACYLHGGVAIEPYRKGFEKLFGQQVTFVETYLASEGFIAYQNRPHTNGMHLAVNNMFFEFVPFDDNNFDGDGNMVDIPETLMLHEIKEDTEYAILITTNAGAWRYAIGDTVKLVNKEHSEIVITGRTKHFMSLVGEHVNVDNMNHVISLVSEKLNIEIPEFTLTGERHGDLFAHRWYIACDSLNVDIENIRTTLDEAMKELNDDYTVERKHALKDVFVTLLPEKTFYAFMESKGKIGGQHKFPRVLKGKMLEDWLAFIK